MNSASEAIVSGASIPSYVQGLAETVYPVIQELNQQVCDSTILHGACKISKKLILFFILPQN